MDRASKMSRSSQRDNWHSSLQTTCPDIYVSRIDDDEESAYFYLPSHIRDWINEGIDTEQAHEQTPTDKGRSTRHKDASPTMSIPTFKPNRLFPVLRTVHDASRADPRVTYLLSLGTDRDYIHPLFDIYRQWKNIDPFSDHDTRIAPALVLASRILTSNASMHFFNTLLFGVRSPGGPGVPGRIWRPNNSADPHAQLSDFAVQTVHNALASLVHESEIVFARLPYGKKGICTAKFLPCFDAVSQQKYIARSSPVKIAVNDGFIAPQSLLMVRDLSNVTPSSLLRCWLKLATTLLAQVSHGVGYACLNTNVELCLGHEHRPDYGLAFEVWMFGKHSPEEWLDEIGIQRVFQRFFG